MCGRFSLSSEDTILALRWAAKLGVARPDLDAPKNAADMVITGEDLRPMSWISVYARIDGRCEFVPMRWGLVPSWAKDDSIGQKTINARAETIAEKPTFKGSFRHKRGATPASSFFESKRTPDGKRTKERTIFRLKSGEPFFLAALWDTWCSPDGSITESASIITTEANELVARIHDRMPVIFTADEAETWVNAKFDPIRLQAMLRPYPARDMVMEAMPMPVKPQAVVSQQTLSLF